MEEVKIDKLKLYFGDDYYVNEYITIKQPTIGDMLEYGEKNIYNVISPFVFNPTSYRVHLWEKGIDWNKITDFDLFLMLYINIDDNYSSVVFKNGINFSELNAVQDCTTNEKYLCDSEFNIIITEQDYKLISSYLREVFMIHPKVEKAKGKITKELMIEEEKRKMELDDKKNDENAKSTLLPLVSSLTNHAGFKYKKKDLKEVNIYEFMDSVSRLQVYESTRALMAGVYSGMLDTSKMNLKEEMNWLKDINL